MAPVERCVAGMTHETYGRNERTQAEPEGAGGESHEQQADLFISAEKTGEPLSGLREFLAAVKKDMFLNGPYSFSGW